MKPRNPYVRACATRRTRFDDKREALRLKALREDAKEVGMNESTATFTGRCVLLGHYMRGYVAGTSNGQQEPSHLFGYDRQLYKAGYAVGVSDLMRAQLAAERILRVTE